MEPLGILAIVGLLVGATLLWRIYSRRQRDEAWTQLATRLGLQFTPATVTQSPSLHGVVDGHRVHVSQYTRGGKNKVTWTRVRVHTEAPLPKGFHVGPQDLQAGFRKLLGGQDIEVGVAGFDDMHVIKGDNEQDVRDFMGSTNAARSIWALKQATALEPEVRSHYVEVDVRGVFPPQLESLIHAGVQCARSLAEARSAPLRSLAALGLTVGLHRAHGTVEGRAVEVDIDFLEGVTTIRSPLDPGLPHPGLIRRGTSALEDPILSRMITIDGPHVERWADLLSDEDLRDDLLTVVHGHPGSTVDASAVTLRLASASDPSLAERVHDAVRLAASLTRVSEGTAGPEGARTRRQRDPTSR